MLIRKRALVPDTEGAGEYRGAPCSVVEFGPVTGSFEIGYSSDGNVNAPKGVRGGARGGKSDQWVESPSGEHRILPPTGMQHIAENEMLIAISTGGGGYGNPHSRSAEKVALDVREKWISEERARDVYAVVLTDLGVVDEVATKALRR